VNLHFKLRKSAYVTLGAILPDIACMIKPIFYYLIHTFLKPNDQHVIKNLSLTIHCKPSVVWLIVYTFLVLKSLLVIVKMSIFSSCFKCLFAVKSLLILLW